MDLLFAAHLGETAQVHVRWCSDNPEKGKGVFSLVNLSPGDVALTDQPMAFVQSSELTAASAAANGADGNARAHTTCATCGEGRTPRGFTGTIQSQLETLMQARSVTCSAPPTKASKKRGPLPPPPSNTLASVSLPHSKDQSTKLRPALPRKADDGSVLEYCSRRCGNGGVSMLRAIAAKQWAEFEKVVGAVPRSDRRCLILGAKLIAHVIAADGVATVEGVRHLQSAPIWDLATDDSVRVGLRKAVSEAWPKLQKALVAAFGASVVKAVANITFCQRPGIWTPSKQSAAVGFATLEGYAALCGAVQMNCVGVKVPSPVVRYIASTPEVNAAPNPLAPVVQWLVSEQRERVSRRVEEEESILNDNGGGGDDDDSDGDDSDSDDGDGDDGDDVLEFDWGKNLTFDTSLFPPMKGAAVYPLVSGINHSCDPNCEVAYIDDSKVLVVLKRHVAMGEELTIAYVDTELSTVERKEQLKEVYGFDCKCGKCAPKPKSKTPSKQNAAAGAAGGKRKASDDNEGVGKGAKKARTEEGNGCVVC